MKAYRIAILYRYLLENTCKGHTVNADNIVEHYENEGDPYEIKAVYRDLHDLEKIEGITLHYDGRTKGWWMEREGLTPNELRLIVDSIQASKFITQERARAITGKVLKLTDRHTRASLNRQSYVAGRVRSMNDSVVDEADKLHEAIASNSKVSFRYFHYTPSKERQYSKSGERYIVSPYALQWNDGNYYLYAYVSEKKDFRTFRVDRMAKIAVLPEKREGKEAFDKVDLNEYQSAVFNMFVKPEKEYTVKLRCINSLADVIIDRFGKDVMLIPDGNDHFTVSVRIQATNPFFGWVCSFGRRMKILHPPAVVQEMDEFLKKITEMYKDEGKM